jgi:protein involved in polysaccharide export with SLBB domain
MGKLGRRAGALTVLGFLLAVVGCSSLGDSIGLSPPGYPLLNDARAIRDTAPVPAPSGRELNKELFPTHLVEPGETLLVQPVDLDSPVRLPPDQPVQSDGTIDLGVYGRPVVAGKSLTQIEAQIRGLIQTRDKGKEFPITVRLIGRPSQVYYVLGEVNAPGAFPLTGRETVLDGLLAAGGVTRRASLGNIVLSRPTAPESCRLVLPVCYQQITQLGDTTTNYQLQPGDRIFVPSKSTHENRFLQRCQPPTPACSRPQVSCFAPGCAPGSAPAPVPRPDPLPTPR